MTPDFHIGDHGSIWLLTPVTEAARSWVAEHIPEDAQRLGRGIAIEPRYVPDIIDGIIDAGLEIGG